MKTYEMVAQADQDGLTYRTDDMYYNKDKGFHDYQGDEWDVLAWDMTDGLNRFIHADGWISVSHFKKVDICCKIDNRYYTYNLEIRLDGERAFVFPMPGEAEAQQFIDFVRTLLETNDDDIDLTIDVVKE